MCADQGSAYKPPVSATLWRGPPVPLPLQIPEEEEEEGLTAEEMEALEEDMQGDFEVAEMIK